MKDLLDVREELLHTYENLSDEVRYWRKEEKDWTIVQVLEHIALLDDYVIGMIERALQESDYTLSENPDLTVLLNRTIKVSAPDFSIPADDVKKEYALQHLQHSREKLIHTYEKLSPEQQTTVTMKHRRFGQISIDKWMNLLGMHEARHVIQIREIIKEHEALVNKHS